MPKFYQIFSRDHRKRLPDSISRFTGLKANSDPFPVPPFSLLKHVSPLTESVVLGWIGSFVGLLLIEAVMIKSSLFDGTWRSPLIIGSFGASAVLVYGSFEAPFATPRAAIGGQMIAAFVGVAFTRLFRLNGAWSINDDTQPDDFSHLVWLAGIMAMATTLSLQQLTGTIHPPGGATALIACTVPAAENMSWRYLFDILVSSLLMCGWAVIWNNLGRRRYPAYWWSKDVSFVRPAPADDAEKANGS